MGERFIKKKKSVITGAGFKITDTFSSSTAWDDF